MINEELIEKTKERIERLKFRLECLERNDPPMPTIDQMRRKALIDALERTGGNRTHAALQLAISVRTIRNWIAKYGVGSETD